MDVIDIIEDSQGFIWFGTSGGLVRYDGYEMKLYVYDELDETSISHNAIWFLFIDQSDNLWVGTIRGGLNRYNRTTDDFTRFFHDPTDPASLPDDDLKSMYQTLDGALWVGTSNGLGRFDPDTDSFVTYRYNPDDPNSISDNSIRVIYEDPKTGLLWLGTRRGGLSIFDPATGQATNYLHDPVDTASLSNDSIDAIYQTKDGVMWIGTRDGLNRFLPESGTFVRYYHDPKDDATVGSNTIAALHEDRKGRFWVGTNVGVDIFDPVAGTFTHYVYREDIATSLAPGYIRTIYEDRVGAIWISTQSGGVSRLSSLPANFVTYLYNPDNPQTISSNNVSFIMPAPQGGYWVIAQNALNYFDGQRFTRYPHDPDDPNGLPAQIVTVLPDQQGNLWIGTEAGGFGYYDLETKIFTAYPIPPPGGTGVVSLKTLDNHGNVWFGHEGRGLVRFDGEEFTFFMPDASNADPTGFPDFYVSDVYYDAQWDTLWVGTSVLVKLNADGKTFTRYPLNPDNPLLLENRIRYIYQSRNGQLWLSSQNGLYRFDPATERYTDRYTTADGFPHFPINQIEEDDDGVLWMNAIDMIIRFNPVTSAVMTYNIDDDLPSESLRALTGGASGEMLAGGLDAGLTIFYPDRIVDNTNIPPVVLTELELFNLPVEIGAEDGILPASINVLDKLVLPFDQTFLTLGFAALNYDRPEKNQYAYMLEGFDDTWRVTTVERRFASYTNIPPGHYTFRVKASNNSGVWNEEGVSLAVEVKPPWWQTPWAYILYVLGAAGAVLGVVQWRTYSVEKRNKALQLQAERDENILATIPTGLILINPARRVVMGNPIAREELPALAGVEIGETIEHFGSRPIEQLLKSPDDGLWHEVCVDDGSGERYFAVLARAIIGEKAPHDWLVAFRDITLERSIQEKAMTQQRLASIGNFTAGIAHDFNNMLAVILLNAQLLKNTIEMNATPEIRCEASKTQLERISHQAGAAHQLISQILDYSRQTVMERQAINLSTVITEQGDLLSKLLTSDFTLTVGLDKAENYYIYGDATQIQQVLMNLVANARDAMPNGGAIDIRLAVSRVAKPSSAVESSLPREWITLTVQDEGTGIPDNMLSKIFEPFVTTKPVGKGTGLGLAQVSGIVEQHDGYIDVQTEAGRGSTFTLYFPRYDAPIVRFPSRPDSTDIVLGNGETILLVEDNSDLMETLGESLKIINYRVLPASDGEMAYHIWQERNEEIDIVVTDIVMPNMNGIELFHVLSEAGAKQSFIFIAGHLLKPETEMHFDMLRAKGGVDWLRKPIHLGELSSILATALSGRNID
ncbi:MAG: response regulator [Caldilineaceae bacterium]|nr:response regulator [Caldilineaceae bacterium]